MAEQIIVYVNDRPVKVFRGMEVRHALISSDYAVYKAVEKGEIAVEDGNGFLLGLEGALQDGARIYTRRAEEKRKARRKRNKPQRALGRGRIKE
jgi:hypothetical protein